MKENLYVLFDKESNIALKPVMASRNDVAPVRDITEAVQDDKSILHKHAADFDLVHIGTIDLETMEVEPCELRVVVRALDLKAQDKPTLAL